MSRNVILLLGLIALALLIFLCVRNLTPVIQEDIQTRTSSVLLSDPTSWTKVSVDGRNVILTGVAPSEALRKKAVETARAVHGVVSVDNQITVAQLASEPDQADSDLIEPQLAIEEALPEPLTRATGSSCSKQFMEKLVGQTIRFTTDSSGVNTQAQIVFDKILEFSASCPNSIIEVAGYTDARGSDSYNLNLSKNRAEAVVNKLISRGMRADRLKAAGYGEANPLSDNNTIEGQANNRRIEFSYLQEGE